MDVYPKFSVITATLNRGDILPQAIESLKAQSYPHIEYIIIDGGSKDNTHSIVERYCKDIDMYVSEPDAGLYDAFNKGVARATGDVLYFLNSDDAFYDSHALQDVASAFQADRCRQVVYGDVVITDGNQYYSIIGEALTRQDMEEGRFCHHQGFFAKRQLFTQHGPFDLTLRFASDYHFMLSCFLSLTPEACHYLHRPICSFHTQGIGSAPQHQAFIHHERQLVLKRHFGAMTPPHLLLQTLYCSWLKKVLTTDRGICHSLYTQGIRKIAIFGTFTTAQCLYADALKAGMTVTCFLDNNLHVQGHELLGVPILSPLRLQKDCDGIDAILISIESNRDRQIKEQLQKITDHKLPLFLWKELIHIDKPLAKGTQVCAF